MSSRRDLLKLTGGLVLATGGSWLAAHARGAVPNPPGLSALPAGAVASGDLEAIAGKVPLIKRAWRPPNYETPLEYFAQDFTPNKAFFVRYHLAGVPAPIAADKWSLKVGGEAVSTPLEITYDQLRRDYPAVELAAVNQCSGNRRGLFDPHVAGVEWGAGAMGNARWKGARLKDVLTKAGLKKEALEIAYDGADGPVMPGTPDFQKSIPVWKALDENTLIAYEMNGEPLPHFNGFPVRLVVPGWTATYWMKHLIAIDAVTKPFEGFWVKTAYRIPTGKFPVTQHFLTQMNETSEPITEMVVNSVITAPAPDHKARRGEPLEVRGVAWDGGYGIDRVEVSIDGGREWREASLGKDHGRFSFRQWSFRFTPTKPGTVTVMAKASNSIGQTQAESLIFNPAGYHNNVMRPLAISVA
jgi:DMSO/TMAO reductase YedYZ molybdopterin-dependent catalytic subunit